MESMQAPGLVIGRFQPFHIGHLDTILKIIEERGSVKIGIGSAQYSHTKDNPFTSYEREQMIRATLEAKIPENLYTIYHIPDIHNYPKWVSHIETIVGEFSAIYTNNPVNEELFTAAGYDVVMHELVEGVSATIVREYLANEDQQWKQMVPEPVASILSGIDAVDRMKDTTSSFSS